MSNIREHRLLTPNQPVMVGADATSSVLAGRIEHTPIIRLTPYKNNARTHSKKQVRQIANSIKRFGFVNPVLVDDAGQIIAGHGRVEAAKLIGLATVPVRGLQGGLWPSSGPWPVQARMLREH
jgi:hypothetical protein